MAKPQVERIAVDPDTLVITVHLSNGYWRKYDLTKVRDVNSDDADSFARLLFGCGITQIENTNELLGLFYLGSLKGWSKEGE